MLHRERRGKEASQDTQRHRFEARRRERQTERDRMLKDNSVRSIWTYLTASPCRETDRQTDRQTETQRLRKIQLHVGPPATNSRID